MPDPAQAQPTPAVRLRKFIDIVVEDKLSFTLVRAVAVDLSVTGMRIMTDQYLAKGSKYTFAMNQNPNLALRGEIRWIRPGDRDTFQCGVLFLDVSRGDQSKLDLFMDMQRQRAAG